MRYSMLIGVSIVKSTVIVISVVIVCAHFSRYEVYNNLGNNLGNSFLSWDGSHGGYGYPVGIGISLRYILSPFSATYSGSGLSASYGIESGVWLFCSAISLRI